MRMVFEHAGRYPSERNNVDRQGRRSATGERFGANIAGGVRRYRGIPAHRPPEQPPEGELVTVERAAEMLGVVLSTVHRWLAEGFLAGEQDTPGAPWRIRMTDGPRAHVVEGRPPGWLTVAEARRALGVSRQTVLQRVKRGELNAVHVRNGLRKGPRFGSSQPIRRSATRSP